jgi:hypothetical protein
MRELKKNQEIKNAVTFKPKILESERIKEKFQGFVDTFIEGMSWCVDEYIAIQMVNNSGSNS